MATKRLRWILGLTLVLIAAAALAGCGGEGEGEIGADGSPGEAAAEGSSNLTLVAYSTPREVYEELIPAFQETEAGGGIDFEQSYGSSGEQRRAVEEGLGADIVALSLEPDVTALVDGGLVAPDWNRNEYRGMVSESVVVFAVREGNPKNIKTWDDLIAEGVEVITPNPFTSGGAQWNIMAAYGAQIAQGRSEPEALAYLDSLFQNVPVQNKSAREALQTFSAGKGDVLLAYENEAIFAKENDQPIDYVIPDQTLLIENPAAITTNSGNPAAAQAFLDFTISSDAQRVFGEKGYRPVDDAVLAELDFPVPPSLFTIDDDLGGWPAVREKFFDPESGEITRIFQGQGIATE